MTSETGAPLGISAAETLRAPAHCALSPRLYPPRRDNWWSRVALVAVYRGGSSCRGRYQWNGTPARDGPRRL